MAVAKNELKDDSLKGDYKAIHMRLEAKFGKADKCENSDCEGTSKTYQYALRHGMKHKHDRTHYVMLCSSCHQQYDKTPGSIKIPKFEKKEMGEVDNEEAKKAMEARSEKYGIGIKEGGNVGKPSEYKDVADDMFADPVNYRYPIDEKHITPAVGYFNHDGQREDGGYTEKEWEVIGKRIAKQAGKAYNNGKVVAKKEMQELAGSYEALRTRLQEAVRKNELFGGAFAVIEDMREPYCWVYAVFDKSLVVARSGKKPIYYQAGWKDEDGKIAFSNVKEVDIELNITQKKEMQDIPGSNEELSTKLYQAIRRNELFGGSFGNELNEPEDYLYVYSTFNDYVIVERSGKKNGYWKANWTKDEDGNIKFSNVTPVELEVNVKVVNEETHPLISSQEGRIEEPQKALLEWLGIKVETKEEAVKKIFELETVEILGFPIFEAGTHNGDEYTEDDLDEIVANFEALKGEIKPPLKIGHMSEDDQKQFLTKGMPSIGWVTGVRREGAKLLADIKNIPKKVGEIINAGSYKRFSAELYINYKKGKDILGKALAAVSLLGADIPAVKTLPDVVALYNENSETRMYFREVDEMAEEKGKDTKEFDEAIAKEKAEAEKAKAELEEQKKAFEEAKAESDKIKAEKEQLDKELSMAASATANLLKERKQSEIATFMEKMKGGGKILPVFESELTALMLDLDDKKVVKFSEKTESGQVVEVEKTHLAIMKGIVEKFPMMVEFDEKTKSVGDTNGDGASKEDIVKKFGEIKDTEEYDGIEVHNKAMAIATKRANGDESQIQKY